MNRRGAVLLETVVCLGLILGPFLLWQVEWLREKRLELNDLQNMRETYDGVLLWK